MSSFEQMSLLNTLFYVALIAAGVFLVISIILFFAFNIPDIFMIKTGRAKKKSVEKMMSVNSQTGRLLGSKGSVKGISGVFGNSVELSSEKTDLLTAPRSSGLTGNQAHNNGGNNNAAQSNYRPQTEETTVLSAANNVGETTVLQNIPKAPAAENKLPYPQPDTTHGMFEIVRYIIKIHTEETIN